MSDDFKTALVVGVMGILFILFALTFVGCQRNVHLDNSFEGHTCIHLQKILGLKEGDTADLEACMAVMMKREEEAAAKGQEREYHLYLECLGEAETYSDAKLCAHIVQ